MFFFLDFWEIETSKTLCGQGKKLRHQTKNKTMNWKQLFPSFLVGWAMCLANGLVIYLELNDDTTIIATLATALLVVMVLLLPRQMNPRGFCERHAGWAFALLLVLNLFATGTLRYHNKVVVVAVATNTSTALATAAVLINAPLFLGFRISSWRRKLLFVLPLLMTLSRVIDAQPQKCLLSLGAEYALPSSRELADMSEAIGGMVLRNHGARPVHPKAHGCVEASFSIDESIPETLRVGLFDKRTSSGTWRAFVRFSNGALQVQDDSVADVRGMAVKLLQIHGDKALGADELVAPPDQYTQDFLAITSDYFFQSDASTYSSFIRAMSGDPKSGGLVGWLMPSSLREFGRRIKVLWTAWNMNRDGSAVINPLYADYYSAVPYRLGEDHLAPNPSIAVKYRWKPCRAPPPPPLSRGLFASWINSFGVGVEREMLVSQRNSSYFLRINLQTRLSDDDDDNEICFDLLLQEQSDACTNKIEDAQTPWIQEWIRVGRLTIPKQTFLGDKQLAFCENLSFNPWHTLKVHRPIGGIGAMRKAAYIAASSARRTINSNKATFSPALSTNYTGHELADLGRADTLAM